MKFFACLIAFMLLSIPVAIAQNETAPWYRNMVYGTVNYSDSTNVESGSVLFLIRASGSVTECAISSGEFSCYISAPAFSQFEVYVAQGSKRYFQTNHIIAEDNLEAGFNLALPFSPGTNNFADEDHDGIPDDEDLCQQGAVSQEEVDRYGCTCPQK